MNTVSAQSHLTSSDRRPQASAGRYRLSVEQIKKYLPHRYPFLMIDRVLDIRPVGDIQDLSYQTKIGIEVVAQKNVSANEPFFQGHFPGHSIMPGVLLLEAMAQTASFSLYPYVEQDLENVSRDFQTIFVGADNVRWRRPVVPGDTLQIETVVTKTRGKLWGFSCKATVDGQLAAEADILANLISDLVQL